MDIRLRPASDSDRDFFQAWIREDGLDRLTCRPVVEGRRVPPSQSVEALAGFLPDVSSPVGRVIFFDPNPRNRSLEVGYLVAPEFRGRGVASVLLAAALDFKFGGSDLNKVHAQTGSFNQPSIRLLEKLGFHRDGVLREHHEREGRLVDDLVYSLLRAEWENQPWRRSIPP